MSTLLLTIMLVVTMVGHARLLHVPSQYPTIQSALDSVENGDTVMVELGTYHESLVTPANVEFVLRGNVQSDTGDYPRPTIDPGTLEHANQIACLTVSYSPAVTVERLTFFNGPAMHFGRAEASVGGIINLANLTVRSCLFDSTHIGLSPGGIRVVAEDCVFRDNVNSCLWSNYTAKLELLRCTFATQRGMLMWLRDSSYVEDCWFQGRLDGGEWMWMLGAGIVVRHCQFGPSAIRSYLPIYTAGLTGLTFESNLFIGLIVGSACVQFSCQCDSPDTTRILGNRFLNNRVQQGQGGGGMRVQCQPPSEGFAAIVSENVFDSCGTTGFFRALLVSDNAYLWQNRFAGPANNNIPAVMITDGWNVVMRDNLFQGTGYALAADNDIPAVDARVNWWGHESGPYHAVLNPDGQGDRVGDNIDFDSWRTDTLFLNVHERLTSLPAAFHLSVFPNPFNATARITFAAPAGEYRLDLFNALGQHVQEIWQGDVSGTELLHFDASNFSTGIYFLRAWEIKVNTTAALEKIVLLK